MSVYKYYKELPAWAKGVVIVGGLTVGFLTGRAAWRKIKSALERGKLLKESQQAGQELNNLSQRGVNPTITRAQAEGFCNSMQQAFNGCGTDENAIFQVANQLQNDADVYLLISVYGARKYDACNWDMDFGDRDLTLSGAISDELDGIEKQHLNDILKGRGIKYQFS